MLKIGGNFWRFNRLDDIFSSCVDEPKSYHSLENVTEYRPDAKIFAEPNEFKLVVYNLRGNVMVEQGGFKSLPDAALFYDDVLREWINGKTKEN